MLKENEDLKSSKTQHEAALKDLNSAQQTLSQDQ